MALLASVRQQKPPPEVGELKEAEEMRLRQGSGFQVSVRTDRRTLTVNLSGAHGYVDEIKRVVQARCGILAEDQCLVYAGKSLRNGEQISSYGISRHSTLMLSLRLRGGAPEGNILRSAASSVQVDEGMAMQQIKEAFLESGCVDVEGRIQQEILEIVFEDLGVSRNAVEHLFAAVCPGKTGLTSLSNILAWMSTEDNEPVHCEEEIVVPALPKPSAIDVEGSVRQEAGEPEAAVEKALPSRSSGDAAIGAPEDAMQQEEEEVGKALPFQSSGDAEIGAPEDAVQQEEAVGKAPPTQSTDEAEIRAPEQAMPHDAETLGEAPPAQSSGDAEIDAPSMEEQREEDTKGKALPPQSNGNVETNVQQESAWQEEEAMGNALPRFGDAERGFGQEGLPHEDETVNKACPPQTFGDVDSDRQEAVNHEEHSVAKPESKEGSGDAQDLPEETVAREPPQHSAEVSISEEAHQASQDEAAAQPPSKHSADAPESERRQLAVMRRDSIKLSPIGDNAAEFLDQLKGFCDFKVVVASGAERQCPQQFANSFASFTDQNKMVQMKLPLQHEAEAGSSAHGRAESIDEVMTAAQAALPKFKEIMAAIVKSAQLDPEEEILLDGRRVVVDERKGIIFKRLTVAPLKSVSRCLDKMEIECDGDVSRIVDVVRCSVVVDTEAQLQAVAEALQSSQETMEYEVVRLKNRFREATFTGYSDALYNIRVRIGENVWHVCEVQLHLSALLEHQAATYRYYLQFRDYFVCDMARVPDRMRVLESACKAYDGNDVDRDDLSYELLEQALASDVEECVKSWADLFGEGMMEEYQLLVPVQRHRLQLAQLTGGTGDILDLREELAYALYLAGAHEESLGIAAQVLDAREQEFGVEHPSTIRPLTMMANVKTKQGAHDEAVILLERILKIMEKESGPEHPSIAATLHTMANARGKQGRYDEASDLYTRALMMKVKTLGAQHPSTTETANAMATLNDQHGSHDEDSEIMGAMGNDNYDDMLNDLANMKEERWYSEASEPNSPVPSRPKKSAPKSVGQGGDAVELHANTLRVKEKILGPDHPSTALTLTSMAAALDEQGSLDEASEAFERALSVQEKAFGVDHPSTTATLNNMASVKSKQGKIDEASDLCSRALKITEKTHGPEHPSTALALNNMATIERRQGKLDEAAKNYARVLSIQEKTLGPEHPSTAETLNSMGTVVRRNGKLSEAAQLYSRALKIKEKTLGQDHPSIADTVNDMAKVEDKQGKYDQASELYTKALGIKEKVFGPEHPSTAATLNNIASVKDKQRKYSEASELYSRALSIKEKTLGSEHPSTAATMNNMATVQDEQGKYEEALELYTRALHVKEKSMGEEHPSTAATLNNMGLVHDKQGRYDEAMALYTRALGILGRTVGQLHPSTAATLNNMATTKDNQGKFDEALELYARALNIKQQTLGFQHPDTADTLFNMGLVKAAQGSKEDAVDFLSRALQIYEEAFGREHPDSLDAARELRRLRQSSKASLASSQVSRKSPSRLV